MRILVLGASGMLGNAMLRVLSEKQEWEIFGTVRSSESARFFSSNIGEYLLTGIDVENQDALIKLFAKVKPNVVVNCVGLVKQLAVADDSLLSISINSLLPLRLARLCDLVGARLVHISTDCVFSGKKGDYRESDLSDAEDVYGKTKFLGELNDSHTVTLRTSIIGHELQGAHSLIGWFLLQDKQCKGFVKAIYSGLPTVVLAQLVRDVIIPRADLSGLYHVASRPISKYDLLSLVAEIYGKSIEIIPDCSLVIDRSLNADRFYKATGYVTPDWPELIKIMHSYQ